MKYDFQSIEKKWQKYWADNKTFRAEDHSPRPKYYVLDMFPYPSGAGLHVGHPLGYIASDIYARYKRLQGFNVLHPMGYDAFGLPAEQYAIQTGKHPATTTEKNMKRYRRQLDQIGFSFDWEREVRTCDPDYYKWTQWIFLQLFHSWYDKDKNKAEPVETLIEKFEKSGSEEVNAATDNEHSFSAGEWKAMSEKEQREVLLKYRLTYLSDSEVNWCPALGTVLANDEVRDGVSERGGHPVQRKKMKQWSMRITAYAERLLQGLEKIDWPDSLKEIQTNWIGKSKGASVHFKVDGFDERIEVFTTRPDTIFGATYMTLAPEHELADKITAEAQKEEVRAYREKSAARSERERMSDVKTISGVFTGAYALHPFSGEKIPIWIGDYVLAGYGTGAVMAVPAHDARDHAFANHFGLPVKEVVSGGNVEEEAFEAKEGELVNSDFLNGLNVKQAIKKAIAKIEEKGIGKGEVNYRLRDAVFSRQRYWGEPFPIYYKDGVPYALDEDKLPLTLPEVDKFLPTESGEPPLARADKWETDEGYPLETNTMPGWAGSSWYYLRYMDPGNDHEFVSGDKVDYWQNVDLYVGGAEHATGHLLYVRFWAKFLFDRGFIPFDEPFKKLINQGMILGNSAFARVISDFKAAVDNFDPSNIEDDNYDPDDLKEDQGTPTMYIIPWNMKGELKGETTKRIPVDYVDYQDGTPVLMKSKMDDLKSGYPQFSEYKIASRDDLKELWRGVTDEIDPSILESVQKEQVLLCSEVEKMSKSKYNVQTPDALCEKYGADTLRMYEMFLGPLTDDKPWDTKGIEGVHRFLKKLWRLFHEDGSFKVTDEKAGKDELKILHKTIKKVREDIERYSFNTVVSELMICVNELSDKKCNKKAILEPLVILLSPYAPHVSEELWSKMGHSESVSYSSLPEYDEQYLKEDSHKYPISFNGKVRFTMEIDAGLSKEEIEKEVLAQEKTQQYTEGKAPKRVIVVPKKIVNIVV